MKEPPSDCDKARARGSHSEPNVSHTKVYDDNRRPAKKCFQRRSGAVVTLPVGRRSRDDVQLISSSLFPVPTLWLMTAVRLRRGQTAPTDSGARNELLVGARNLPREVDATRQLRYSSLASGAKHRTTGHTTQQQLEGQLDSSDTGTVRRKLSTSL